ncbi:MAG: HAMP domain-containing histidine kinase, partial [Thiotrichaceae bacterium]|nr:HAMP domain-containing histidine kinase [Thiotrichaceae bacterium]
MTKEQDDCARISALKKENNILTAAMRQCSLVHKRLQNALNLLRQKDKLLKSTQKQLQENYQQLQNMQQQMLEREKMVALGSLVAGVAHEVNTPLGVAITSTSMIFDGARKLRHSFEISDLSEEQLLGFLDNIDETAHILKQNLDRAANLIRSFKMISVDQNTDDLRHINIKEYLNNIVITFRNQLKKIPIEVNIDCPDDLLVELYSRPFAQLITNLLQNAIIHAFEPGQQQQGLIDIKVTAQTDGLLLIVADNGKGMSEELQQRAFEPFVTTRRNQGGSGLGLNIVYNIVTQTFAGTIKLDSK